MVVFWFSELLQIGWDKQKVGAHLLMTVFLMCSHWMVQGLHTASDYSSQFLLLEILGCSTQYVNNHYSTTPSIQKLQGFQIAVESRSN